MSAYDPYQQPQYHQPHQPQPPHQPYPPRGAMVGPGGYGAPPPKKTSGGKIVLFVFLGILALCVAGGLVGALGGGSGAGTDTAAAPSGDAPEQSAKSEEKPAGLNTPVRDGKFEFTVTSVQCGKTTVGTEYLNKTAQGQFCLVAVTVKNIGDVAQLFDASSQKAHNAQGQEYAADSEASIYVNSEGQTFLEQINPGNSVNGTLVWDIPKGQKLATLELHDSPFSGGVEVSVG
ncbi:DUF4352 domain-containing protein [Cryptosporangium aurantiacum]|uniref:DUF4352 domain-containing protein n=1 Tax=Cryptosporangium aurantiacum TaxID=134849 RepID=A0A1M7RNW0_9ACTN|nr:DUF4352 domain-containing protein [Cryptosporangium aurantiacum]SHN47891.1 protein of unknown function [Cryptosporangium aurantiacum]